jgi:hypothetical protein
MLKAVETEKLILLVFAPVLRLISSTSPTLVCGKNRFAVELEDVTE